MLEGDWQLTLFKSSTGFPWNFKSAGARIAGNSAANDEGRALAARWRDKNVMAALTLQCPISLILAFSSKIYLNAEY